MPNPPATPANPYRWFVLAGAWLTYLCFGLVAMSMAPLVEPVTSDLNISHATMGMILAAWQFVYIGSALPVGAVLDRVGSRYVFVAAALIMGISAIMRAFAEGPVGMFLAVAFFGLGGPLVSIGAPKMISAWFAGRERGLAMGVYISGSALGTVMVFALTNSVMMPFFGQDWRKVMIVYGLFVISSGLLWYVISSFMKDGVDEPARASRPRISHLTVVRGLMSVSTVRIVLLMSAGIFFFNHGLNNWLPEILKDGGMNAAEAGYWASIPIVVGVFASLMIPPQALPPRRFWLLIALDISMFLGALLLLSSSGPLLITALFLQGLVRGSLVTLAMLILIDLPEVGPARAGTVGGIFFTAAEVGAIGGPIMIGTFYDLTSGFSMSLYLFAGVAVALMGLSIRLRPYLNPPDLKGAPPAGS